MNDQNGVPQKIRHALESLRDVPARDQRVTVRRRQDFLNQVDRLPVHRGLGWFQSASHVVRFVAAALLLIVLLAGTTATALAAQGSLPGSLLYPIKTTLEDAQFAFARNPADQFSLLQTFTARRFVEMDTLLADRAALPLSLDEQLQKHFQAMVALSAEMDDAALEQSLVGLRDMLQVREQLMTANAGQADDPIYAQIRQRVQEMNQLAQAGLVDPNQFRWQHENQNGGSDGIPNPDLGPGPDAGPGPGEPPTQERPGATPTPGSGQGSGGTPTDQPAPTQGGAGGTPTPGSGQGSGGTPTDQPAPTQGHLGGTPTDHPGGRKP